MNRAESRLLQVLFLLGYDSEKYPEHVCRELLKELYRFADATGDSELAIACQRYLTALEPFSAYEIGVSATEYLPVSEYPTGRRRRK
ncbi:hypothetical protein H3B90_003578 [Escherichia coli]|nr:hypothetical protein [Escherichia coli]